MADRVHPMPAPPPPSSSPPPEHAAAATETTPLHPSFRGSPPPSPGTYIIQIPKDQVLRVPPPDRARRYKKLAARPARRRRLRHACCAAFCAALLLLLLAAAFVGAVYLVFRPRAPSFSVASLSIRGLDALAVSSLTPQIDAAVRADNGANKKTGIDYRGGGEM
uniref:Late embryogenesis abundant protein LEA-2 subgroup domain-containing protein n=1 Tax=Oryza glumipatula TaxID=40148 RepID=A0A0E0BEU9_9ORYZ